MTRQLRIQKFELGPHVNYLWLGAFRLRIEVTDPNNSGADPNVFMYLRDLPNPYDGSVNDYWQGITSTCDLADYPVGEPNGRTEFPYYRLNYIEQDVRSAHLGEKLWEMVVQDIENLIIALNMLDNLVPTEVVWIGPDPPTPPASDSSASLSQASASSLSV